MATNIPLNTAPLVHVCWPEKEDYKWQRLAVLCVVGSFLLAVSAKIQVPFWPVPITMQTMVVLILGLTFGWRLGGLTYLLYLLEGALGLPVFAKGAGVAYIVGPTGGDLFGMFLACLIVGKLAEWGWDKKFFTTAAAMLLGNIIIYIPGLLWLGAVVGGSKPILDWGFFPFIYGDILKIVLATLLIPSAWKFIDWVKK